SEREHLGTAHGVPAVARRLSARHPFRCRSRHVADGPRRPAYLGPAPDDVVGILVALMVAVGLGAFHALTPGHGKTVMAAYLVGTRGSHAQALILALAVALSHTAGVLALAVLTLAGSAILAPERAYP